MPEKKPCNGLIAQLLNPLSDPRVKAIVDEARKEYNERFEP